MVYHIETWRRLKKAVKQFTYFVPYIELKTWKQWMCFLAVVTLYYFPSPWKLQFISFSFLTISGYLLTFPRDIAVPIWVFLFLKTGQVIKKAPRDESE